MQSPLAEIYSGLANQPDIDLKRTVDGAAVFDLSHWSHVWHENGVPTEMADAVTRDLSALGTGSCTEALILNDDGTVASHVDVWLDQEAFTYQHRPADGPGTHAIFSLVGPASSAVIGAVLGDAPKSGEVLRVEWTDRPVLAAGNGPTYGSTVTVAAPAELGSEVLAAVIAEGGELAGAAAFTALRTQAGELDWGADSLPQLTPMEADLTHLIDPEARFDGRRAYRRSLRRGNQRAVVGFVARNCLPVVGSPLRAGDSHGSVSAIMKHPTAEHPVGMGWLDPAPVFHRGSKAFGDPLPQLEVSIEGVWYPVSLSDPPFNRQQ